MIWKKTSRTLSCVIIFSLWIAALSGCNKISEDPTAAPTDPPTSVEVTQAAQTEEPATEEPTTEEVTTEEPTQAPVTISLVTIGDMLMHYTINNQARWSYERTGVWDYSYLFSEIKDDIAAADIAVVNNEVIFGGNTRGDGYGCQNYPNFCTRTELGDAEVAAGFDVILNASNHTMDMDFLGIENTLKFWSTAHPDITCLGIHASPEDDKKVAVREVNGVRVAMLNYTYGVNWVAGLPEGKEYAIDYIIWGTSEAEVAEDIARAKEVADVVVVFPHWGREYDFEPNDSAKYWAQFFADHGVDLVIGMHPHVVQRVEWITGADNHKMLCYYSLGNYTSLQYYHFSMLGGMAKVEITKDSTGTYISDYGIDFLVTHYNEDRSAMTTYYLDDYTNELAAAHAWTGYNDINNDYPFTVEGLKALAKRLCPELVDY